VIKWYAHNRLHKQPMSFQIVQFVLIIRQPHRDKISSKGEPDIFVQHEHISFTVTLSCNSPTINRNISHVRPYYNRLVTDTLRKPIIQTDLSKPRRVVRQPIRLKDYELN